MDLWTPPWVLCGVALAGALLVYARTIGYDIITLDDPLYLTQNPNVVGGLTWNNLRWAFTEATTLVYWHPVTWVSLQADASLFGVWPGGFHAVNVLLHLLNVGLAFALFLRLTGEKWCAAFATFLFAVHPAHQESVAWITERKDILFMFWGLLALHCYLWWSAARRRWVMALFLICYALSLMSKPTLVVLPPLLLLLDYWPLKRFDPYALWDEVRGQGLGAVRRSPLPGLLLEKLPALGLAALITVTTLVSVTGPDVVVAFGISQRLGNACVSYLVYFYKLFVPLDLAIVYPFPQHQPLWQVAGSLALLLSAAVLVVRLGRRLPWLLVGAFWFVFGLAPTIIIPKYGLQVALADRFTYFPFLGAYLALAVGGGEALRAHIADARRRSLILAAGGGAFCLWLLALALLSIGYWRDTATLYRRTLEVTQLNYAIDSNYGDLLIGRGDLAGAERHLLRALEAALQLGSALMNLAGVYVTTGRFKLAVEMFDRASAVDPKYLGNMAAFHYGYGLSLAQLGRYDEAEAQYRKAIEVNPAYAEAHNDLGYIALLRGETQKAGELFARAVELKPDYLVAQQNLLRVRQVLAAKLP